MRLTRTKQDVAGDGSRVILGTIMMLQNEPVACDKEYLTLCSLLMELGAEYLSLTGEIYLPEWPEPPEPKGLIGGLYAQILAA